MNDDQGSTENVNYSRNDKSASKKYMLSNVIHPTLVKHTFRKQFLEHEMLGSEHRQNGLDILRLKVGELN